jgi:glycosyltransferase involved in cell wall biosynthesis
MQAMMSGLPIVTTATCGMKDVVVDRRNGLLVPIRRPDRVCAAVEELMVNRELRKALGCAARAAALERHTWDSAAAPILRTYEELT